MFSPEAPVVGAFVLTSLALNVTPGVDMTYVVGTTLRWRTRAGVCAALGIAAGSLCHMLLAAAGLSAVVAASPALMNTITLAGAAYLVWTGVGMLRDPSPATAPQPTAVGITGAEAPAHSASTRAAVTTDHRPHLARVMTQGALINLLNVKVIIFYLSFIPQFVRPETGPTWQQVGFYGLLFNLIGTSTLILVALLTGRATRGVLRGPRAALGARRVCGVTLVVMALVLTATRLLTW